MNEDSILRSGLSEILKGYSYSVENNFYIKHMALDDHVDYERVYSFFYERLKKRGVEASEVLIERAIAQDLWSDEKDKKIKDLSELCEQLTLTIQKSLAEDMKNHAKKELQNNQKEHDNLMAQKYAITSSSIESITNNRMHEYYIVNSLYLDKDLNQKKFNEKDFDEIEPEELSKINKSYNKCTEKLNDSNIRKISIKDFFQSSWNLSKNPYYYFGKPISDITYFQTRLATSANMFANIFKNYPGIESEDPDEIIEFAQMRYEAQKNEGKNRSFTGADTEKLRRAGINVPDRSAQFNNAR
tara:strand:+ start:5312 stop:6211 length:900 start_codon:yes stop_codon:yes gene_type:complete